MSRSYNSETGDVIDYDDMQQQGPVAYEPLRVPGLVEHFLANYIPADSPITASDWIGIAELRTMMSSYPPFGAKEDPLQEALDALASEGFYMHDIGLDVPYILATRKTSPSVINVYDNADVLP